MVQRAYFEVSVGGTPVTDRLSPHLISIEISDKEGTQNDTCSITLDDKNAQLRLPKDGDPISVILGWAGSGGSIVFIGVVDEVKSSGSRSGRTLQVSAKGVDTKSKAKEPQQKHMDNKTLKEALNEAGKLSGHTVEVDPGLADIKRDWWGMNDESFLHFGERVAREVGGIFKVQGNRAILCDKTGGSVSGIAMPVISARWGDNLISWDIKPFMGRPQFANTCSRWYDLKKAKWEEEKQKVKGTDAKADMKDRYSRHDKDEAKASAKNSAKDSEKEKGGGTVSINGTAYARPGGTCIVVGARPGVDGPWRIEEVKHKFDRSGWITDLTLKMPGEGTGKDSRK